MIGGEVGPEAWADHTLNWEVTEASYLQLYELLVDIGLCIDVTYRMMVQEADE